MPEIDCGEQDRWIDARSLLGSGLGGETRKWLIVVPEDLESIPKFGLLKAREHGTLVVWQELDRLLAGATDPVEEIKLKFAPLFNHLALVFHRFRSGRMDVHR